MGTQIRADRERSRADGTTKTITLINVDDLARLVRLRPVKQIGLQKLRELFQKCSLPDDSAAWVESIRQTAVEKATLPQDRRDDRGATKEIQKNRL